MVGVYPWLRLYTSKIESSDPQRRSEGSQDSPDEGTSRVDYSGLDN